MHQMWKDISGQEGNNVMSHWLVSSTSSSTLFLPAMVTASFPSVSWSPLQPTSGSRQRSKLLLVLQTIWGINPEPQHPSPGLKRSQILLNQGKQGTLRTLKRWDGAKFVTKKWRMFLSWQIIWSAVTCSATSRKSLHRFTMAENAKNAARTTLRMQFGNILALSTKSWMKPRRRLQSIWHSFHGHRSIDELILIFRVLEYDTWLH